MAGSAPEELAALTARWLRGHLLWHPNWHAAPDPETVPLGKALAAASEAGFLTEGPQPGELATYHELPWWHRAFVSGFVADPALARPCARGPPRPGWHEDPGEGETLHADLDSVEFLRTSGYGIWAQRSLAAAMRTAADLLDAAETG
ncbi:DUF6919 domain-containing protein [Streptomyces sp. NPDC017943]|uniref:DUF6919 domain-containing protein n=1 Tax=Streptomyces sp. NPDC017943 TaxID=3365019 RepID=UPI0037B08F57